MSTELERIREQLAGITRGPWKVEAIMEGKFAGLESRVYSLRGSHILLSPTDGEAGQATNANAAFIAAAPSTVERLLGIVDAALNACEAIIDNADGHKPPGPPNPSREQMAALRIQRAIRAAITGEGGE